MGVWGRVLYGVPNKGRLGSGVPHREPSVLHVIVEAVAGDLGASQSSSQLPGEEGGANEGKSSCLTSRIGVARGERETARDLHPEAGSVQPGEWRGLLEAGVQSSTSSSGVTPCLRGVGGGGGVPRGGGLAVRSSGENMGGSSRSDSSSCSCACPSCCGRRAEVTYPRRMGDLRRPMSASVSACVFPTMPTCEGTCSQRTLVPWGGGICILFEICVKRPFQKCMGWGGIGDHIFEYRGRTFRRFRVFGPQAAPLTRVGHQLTGFPLGTPTYCGVEAK